MTTPEPPPDVMARLAEANPLRGEDGDRALSAPAQADLERILHLPRRRAGRRRRVATIGLAATVAAGIAGVWIVGHRQDPTPIRIEVGSGNTGDLYVFDNPIADPGRIPSGLKALGATSIGGCRPLVAKTRILSSTGFWNGPTVTPFVMPTVNGSVGVYVEAVTYGRPVPLRPVHMYRCVPRRLAERGVIAIQGAHSGASVPETMTFGFSPRGFSTAIANGEVRPAFGTFAFYVSRPSRVTLHRRGEDLVIDQNGVLSRSLVSRRLIDRGSCLTTCGLVVNATNKGVYSSYDWPHPRPRIVPPSAFSDAQAVAVSSICQAAISLRDSHGAPTGQESDRVIPRVRGKQRLRWFKVPPNGSATVTSMTCQLP